MASAVLDTHTLVFPAPGLRRDEGRVDSPRHLTDDDWTRGINRAYLVAEWEERFLYPVVDSSPAA
jgi:hypothetical protein